MDSEIAEREVLVFNLEARKIGCRLVVLVAEIASVALHIHAYQARLVFCGAADAERTIAMRLNMRLQLYVRREKIVVGWVAVEARTLVVVSDEVLDADSVRHVNIVAATPLVLLLALDLAPMVFISC